MAFTYDVLTESEAMQERFQLLKDGEYDAIIASSEDRMSKNSGNPMMDMTLSVYDDNGHIHTVRDFLVFTKSMMWKIVHCADSAGLSKEYLDQKFCSDIIVGKSVRVKISTEEGGEIPLPNLNGKAIGSKYPSKNKVDDYVGSCGNKPLTYKANAEDKFKDDDIMF